MNVLRRIARRWLLVPQLLLFFWLALNSVVADSPTMDEQNHLARGLAFLGTGDPRLSLEHPPLVNSLSALPVHALLDVRLPTDHPSWERPEGWYEFADLLLWHYNHDVARMIFLARLPIVFLGMGLSLVGFHFARLLWGGPEAMQRGRIAGILAAFFLLFDPNIMAHSRYTTTDLGAACFVLLASALLWRLWRARTPTLGQLLAASAGLALAFGGKLSTLVFVPSFILLALMPLYGGDWHWRGAWRRLLQLTAAGAGALLLLWLLYGFQWGPFFFRSARLAPLNRFAGPMPTYWAGIEQILFVSGGSRPAFLLGETSTEGFVAYFPLAFLVKTPLAMLLLLALALGVLAAAAYTAFRQRRAGVETGYPVAAAVSVLVPAVFYFLASMTSNLNIGYRHLLPILPLLYVFVAGTVAHLLQHGIGARVRQGARDASRVLGLGISLLLAAFFLSTLAIHPHYIGYFNLLAGGPANGYRVLGDSNVDWGQDLLRLQAWLQEHGVDRVKLSWFGSANPAYYGINYDPLPGLPRHYALWHQPPTLWPAREWPVPYDPDDPPAGIYAISATLLGEMYRTSEIALFTQFREQEPIARIGNSIFIYQVPANDQAADLVLPYEQQLQPTLAPTLASNDVRVRRFDAATTFIWPAFGGWLAVPAELQPGTSVAPFWPTAPTTSSDGQVLYRLPPAEDTLGLKPPRAGDVALEGTPLHFLGYRDVAVEAEAIELLTAWQVANATAQPLQLFVHGLDAQGNIIAQWDGLDLSPEALLPGDRFVHAHRLAVTGDAVVQLAAGVYDGQTLERLSDYLLLSAPEAN